MFFREWSKRTCFTSLFVTVETILTPCRTSRLLVFSLLIRPAPQKPRVQLFCTKILLFWFRLDPRQHVCFKERTTASLPGQTIASRPAHISDYCVRWRSSALLYDQTPTIGFVFGAKEGFRFGAALTLVVLIRRAWEAGLTLFLVDLESPGEWESLFYLRLSGKKNISFFHTFLR